MNRHTTQGFDYTELSHTQNQTDNGVIHEGSDAPDRADSSYQLEVGTNFLGTLDRYGDKDIFAIELTAAQSYTIELDGYGESGSVGPTPYIEGPNGYVEGTISKVYLHEGDEKPTIVFTPNISGTFYIGASAYYRDAVGEYSFTLNPLNPITEPEDPTTEPEEPTNPEPVPSPFTFNWIVEEEDAPSGFDTPYKVEVGDTFEGFLSSASDIDTVEMDLEFGHRYAISLNTSSDSPNLAVKNTAGSTTVSSSNSPDYIEVTADIDIYDHYLMVADLDALEASGYTVTVNKIVTNGSEVDDVLHGDRYDNTITTGDGNDLIRYTSKYFGNDTITDFTAGAGSEDIIEISTALFSDFDDLLSNAQDVSGDSTLITFDDGNSFLLEGVAIADLHTDDFSFV